MKKVVKKTATTAKATQPVEKVVKKKPVKKVVSKKKTDNHYEQLLVEDTLNLIYDEIIAVAAGLGESTDEYVAVIDEATSVLVEQDQEKLEGILASTKEQVESMTSKKKPSKKPAKESKKKVVADKPKKEDKPATPEKEVVAKKADPKEGEITEFDGIKIGDIINHPKNGKGEVKGFHKDKNKGIYHPKIKFESGRLSIISIKVASVCK